MSDRIVVYKGRTNIVGVSLGYDVSADTITSEIREKPDQGSTLIATWDVVKLSGGTTGELTLTLDDTVTAAIEQKTGYMDIKRTSAGEPLTVFEHPLEVSFMGTVTT